MASGGVATEKSVKVKWLEEKTLNRTEKRQLLSVNVTSSQMTDHREDEKGISVKRGRELLTERDELWREHERSRFAFMEREQKRFLTVLHGEIEQLQQQCNDITLELAKALADAEGLRETSDSGSHEEKSGVAQTKPTETDLLDEIEEARDKLISLKMVTQAKEEQIGDLERRYIEQETRFRECLDQRNKKIKETLIDLNQKAAIATQLMIQLHHLRLRRTVDKQKRQLGDQNVKRRQILLTSGTDAWSRLMTTDAGPSTDSDHQSTPSVGSYHSQMRASILPRLFPPSSLTQSDLARAGNIEKPGGFTRSKPLRSSLRRSSSLNQNEHGDDGEGGVV